MGDLSCGDIVEEVLIGPGASTMSCMSKVEKAAIASRTWSIFKKFERPKFCFLCFSKCLSCCLQVGVSATTASSSTLSSDGLRFAAAFTKKFSWCAADKKKMLLKIYHTKKEPFNLKELTKLAKAAGLAEKLVQDVNTC